VEVNIATRESDFESNIGVHVQDEEGVCISLGRDDPWHWISNECAEGLVSTLLVSTAAGDVLRERKRQLLYGYDAAHDDVRGAEALAQAAACYASLASGYPDNGLGEQPYWPFHLEVLDPTNKRQNMVCAAALLLAAIDRQDRADQRASAETPAAL
jgi:hypothetical protein